LAWGRLNSVRGIGCCSTGDCQFLCPKASCTAICRNRPQPCPKRDSESGELVYGKCVWSRGNTCTNWCDNGPCLYYDNVNPPGYYKNQVCCSGHKYDTRVVPCDGGRWRL
jgi:hypothetical protein